MREESQTKRQLLAELKKSRQRVAKLEAKLEQLDHELAASQKRYQQLTENSELESANRQLRKEIAERNQAQEALRNEKNRVRQYLELAGVIFIAVDAHGRVTLANRKACEILSCREEDILGKNWCEMFLPDEAKEEVGSMLRRAMSRQFNGTVEYHEHAVLTLTGEKRIIAWHNSILKDGAGEPLGLLASGEDITDRKRAEEALRQSEARNRAIVDAIPDIMIRQRGDGTILDVKAPSEDLLAVPPDKIVGRKAHELGLPPQFVDRIQQLMKTALATGTLQSSEYMLDVPMGRRDFEARLAPCGEDEALYIIRDITERKRAEEQLRQYQRIVATSRNHMALVDRNYVHQTVNDAYLQTVNRKREDIIGHSVPELFGRDFFETYQKPHIDRCLAGESVQYQIWIDFPAAGRRFMEVALFPYRDDEGAVSGYVVNARDITEQKELETQLEQARKMEAIGALAGGVAHDFNNLLSPILGYAELILMDLHPEDPRYESVNEIREATSRAKELTQQLLAFSRKQVLEMKTFSLREVVSGFEKMLRRTIRDDIELIMSLDSSPDPIRGDVSQIERVLMNLAINAQDAMPHGGTLTIETAGIRVDGAFIKDHPGALSGHYVLLKFHDTGTGIDQDNVGHIFEPFFTTKERNKGTGLGLATVYGIVKQHNGNIWVHSEPGAGTTFEIVLPRLDESESVEPRARAEVSGYRGNETVMVVEDNDLVRHLACDILREHGYEVIEAASGDECLRIFEHIGPVHLLLTDVVMPDMNGRELWQRISTLRREMKVVYMSGHADDLLARHGVVGGTSFISKPFSVATLTGKVREVLDG